ncbi:hypothetical protein HPB50_021545 [Hyalomma asiaticum]|uniref:Uncharacterized protein n=1 Tax=Hyalomma asiaticum TaxID=266040 RepID=A0ACB7TNL0_HYAAI|nr:hypothetical protein HPB50_021545 [Hyalomma asiaticum]
MERIRPDLRTYSKTETLDIQPSDVSISKDELTTAATTTTGGIDSYFSQSMQLPSPLYFKYWALSTAPTVRASRWPALLICHAYSPFPGAQRSPCTRALPVTTAQTPRLSPLAWFSARHAERREHSQTMQPTASLAGAGTARRAKRTTCQNHCFLRAWTEHAVASSPAAGGSALLLGAREHHGNDDSEGPLRLRDEARRRSGCVVVGANGHRSCVRDALTARRLRRMVKRSSGPTRGDRGNRRERRVLFFSPRWGGARESGAESAGGWRTERRWVALPGNWLPAASSCSSFCPSFHNHRCPLTRAEADDDAQEHD